jgi:multidrug resistance protein MdtO
MASAPYLPSLRDVSLPRRLWQDLLPTPGRLRRALRMTLTSIAVLILMLVLQMPYTAYGLYAILVVCAESPSASFKVGLAVIVVACFAILIEISVIVLTDNDPVARLLSLSIVSFLAGMIVAGTTVPSLGPILGLLYGVFVSFWETQASETVLVNNSLRLLAAFAFAIACAVAVEYALGAKSPVVLLRAEITKRFRALATMYQACSEETPSPLRHQSAMQVSRLAAAGTAGMLSLYNEIADRNLSPVGLPRAAHLKIFMLGPLLDDSAALGFDDVLLESPEAKRRCGALAAKFSRFADNQHEHNEAIDDFSPSLSVLPSRIESLTGALDLMSREAQEDPPIHLDFVPAGNAPLIIPGALRRAENVAFALKLSLCATLCYILYHAVNWPGISTSVTTVMVASFATTGAMKQRLIFRLGGAVIGGLLLGLGSTIFLFPYMDSLTSLCILVGLVAFGSAWIASGPRLGYVGLQIAFSFYFVTLAGPSGPTELAPSRDRLVGILLALLVMWFVFDQLWPVRTVTAMRGTLARVLRHAAEVFRIDPASVTKDHPGTVELGLRRQISLELAEIRSLDETVEFELGLERLQLEHASDLVVETSLSVAALVWSYLSTLRNPDRKIPEESGTTAVAQIVAGELQRMADSVDKRDRNSQQGPFTEAIQSAIFGRFSLDERTLHMLAHYDEVKKLIRRLDQLEASRQVASSPVVSG